MVYDYLTSENGEVFACNCEVSARRVLAGLLYFAGNLPPTIALYNPQFQKTCIIKIAPQIQRNQTPTLLSSPNDNLQIDVEKLL
ncbi:MAG: hypothetical protein KME42_14075 [Tildeniella nuda ZEHNDER 1965/U140]|jgi:hypothetical protein|nr:hypothetical protein [Tildeniella nuda ZEHNDER 1965/U140]